MYGAIFGDIIGSRFEFDRGGKTKDFELFTPDDHFTDDTAMTVAVADGLLKAGKDADADTIRTTVTASMREWAEKYPNAGYGGRFFEWLFFSKDPQPYGSYGNGSAMRVSAAGWLYDSLERTREVARATADVTHNHPEGIKGAECTAAVIYLARTGASKEEIEDYVVKQFGYDFTESLDEMRNRHKHVESCQDSLPKALRSFFDGNSYEDVVRNAVSLGGDTDTLGAIAGAMAEAFYRIPILICAEGKTYLPKDMLAVIDRFDTACGRVPSDKTNPYARNSIIKLAVEKIYELESQENFVRVITAIQKRLEEHAEVIVPVIDENHVMDSVDPEKLTIGGTLKIEHEMRLTIDKLINEHGDIWVPLYTDEEEINKGETSNIRINMDLLTVIEEAVCYEKSNGLIINPFGKRMVIPKKYLQILLLEDRMMRDIKGE